MIGLVFSKRVVAHIAGVTPIPQWRVEVIKFRETALRLPQYGSAFFSTVLLSASTLLFLATGNWIGAGLMGCVGASMVWRLYHSYQPIRQAWPQSCADTSTPHWLTSPVVEMTWLRYNYDEDMAERVEALRYMTFYGSQPLPDDVEAVARAAMAMGLTPEVEHFYEDPFLFVRIGNRPVYLKHW